MANSVSCPNCNRLLQVPPDHDGGEVRCPVCATSFVGGTQTNVTTQAPQPAAPSAAEVREHIGEAPRQLRRPYAGLVDDDDAPARTISGRRFTPSGGLGLAVTVLLGLNLLLGLLVLGSDYLQYQLANRLIAGVNVPDIELESNDARQMVLGLAHSGVFLVCGIVFLIWFHRAYANLEPLGAGRLTYSSGWAVGCWFVPILNLFRPLQIAQEIWRNSDPNALTQEGIRRAAEASSDLVGGWWAMWIISNVISRISAGMAGAVKSPESLRTATIAGMIAEWATILAALLAMVVVMNINARQTERAEALRAQADLLEKDEE